MKRLSLPKISPFILISYVIILFFLPKIIFGQIPIPADSLLGLYHPFRDRSFEGYSPGKFPVKNPLITDSVLQTYPWKKLAVDSFKNLNFPLWNPYSFSGQPLLANIQSAPFQFINVLFFIFPFNIAWAMQIILPLILTGISMFLFLRSLELSRLSSFFGAVVLPFSGYFVAWMTWGGIISTAMFLPLILFCVNNLFKNFSPLLFLVLIFSLSQTILSGHWQTAFYVFLAALLFALFKLLSHKSLKSVGIFIISVVLAILISSLQILPSMEFLDLSSREIDQAYFEGRRDWFIPPQHLIQLFAPDFFGNPTTYNYWGVWNYGEYVSFIGILPLFFAGVVLITKHRKISFFLTLAAISIILSLENPLSKIPYNLNLPFISSMQPSRIIFLLVFSLVTISAFGFEVFRKEKANRRWAIPAILITVIVLLLIAATQFGKDFFPSVKALDTSNIAFRNLIIPLVFSAATLIFIALSFLKFPKKYLMIVIIALTLAELYRFANKFTPFTKISSIFPKTATTDFLIKQEKPFRIMTTDRRILHPNTSAVYKIESIYGYDPLFLNDYAKLVSTWESGEVLEAGSFNRIVTPHNYESSIADLLNIKYVLSFDEIQNSKLEKIFEEGATKVYINRDAVPRFFFVDEVIKVENRDEELKRLLDPNFDIRTLGVSSDFNYQKIQNQTKIDIEKYSDQSITLNVLTDSEAPLIVTNVNYPGWKAFVDGEVADIRKVNFMFQSIVVPNGQHKIEFKYQPQSFYNGLRLSGLGLFLTMVVALILWRKKYR